jgi:cytochrome c oxidase assembly factor CtaG
MHDLAPNFWLTEWHWEPSILIGTAIIVGLYLYAIGPSRKRYYPTEQVKANKIVAFLLGMLLMFLALVSPLDELGDTYLFSAHMVQHLFLTIIGPPLLLFGIPEWLAKPLLHNRTVFRIAKILTLPAVAFLIYNVDFWLWHAPPLYNATLENEGIHILEHLTFIGFGLLYWWPVFSPLKQGLPPLSFGGQILYLFLSGMPTVALGAGLTFLPPLYAPYLTAPRIWGISAATDQQLGGLIMWIPGNILFIVIVSFLFIRWMQEQEAKQIAKEAAE